VNTPSSNRRGVQVVFFGLGGAFFLIGIAPLLDSLRDVDGRALLLKHDWSSREFNELASTVVCMLVFAAIFLFCAVLVKNAGVRGLFFMASINAISLTGSLFDAKSLILAFPLCLSLIGLIVEICRTLGRTTRKLA
jgi:hypothetical protein